MSTVACASQRHTYLFNLGVGGNGRMTTDNVTLAGSARSETPGVVGLQHLHHWSGVKPAPRNNREYFHRGGVAAPQLVIFGLSRRSQDLGTLQTDFDETSPSQPTPLCAAAAVMCCSAYKERRPSPAASTSMTLSGTPMSRGTSVSCGGGHSSMPVPRRMERSKQQPQLLVTDTAFDVISESPTMSWSTQYYTGSAWWGQTSYCVHRNGLEQWRHSVLQRPLPLRQECSL